MNKSTRWIIIGLVVVAGGGCLASFACCGGFAMFGLSLITDETRAALENNPTVIEKIGTIETFTMNWTDTMGKGDGDVYHFDVVGNKGRGQIITESEEVGGDTIVNSAKLVLSTGEEFDLMEAASGPEDDPVMELEVPGDLEPAAMPEESSELEPAGR